MAFGQRRMQCKRLFGRVQWLAIQHGRRKRSPTPTRSVLDEWRGRWAKPDVVTTAPMTCRRASLSTLTPTSDRTQRAGCTPAPPISTESTWRSASTSIASTWRFPSVDWRRQVSLLGAFYEAHNASICQPENRRKDIGAVDLVFGTVSPRVRCCSHKPCSRVSRLSWILFLQVCTLQLPSYSLRCSLSFDTHSIILHRGEFPTVLTQPRFKWIEPATSLLCKPACTVYTYATTPPPPLTEWSMYYFLPDIT